MTRPATGPRAAGRPRDDPPRVRRDLILLVAGVAVSTAGDAAALTALQVSLRAAGAGWVAALLGAQLLPVVLLAPVAGRLVDRRENRRLLVLALAGQGVVAVPLALVSAPWAVVTLLAGLAAFAAVVRPATSALVPAITGEEGAPVGFARIALGTGLGLIAGPAAGGLLTGAFGTRAALGANAATFVVLACACAALRTRRDPRAAAPGASPASAPSGWRLIRADPALRIGLSVSGIAVACAVVDNVAAPFRFMDQLGATPGGFGAYLALWGVGALVGAQVAPALGRRFGVERGLAAGNVLAGVGIAGIGFAPALGVAFAASVVGGIGNGLASVSQNALVSSRTPPAWRGRAFAAAGAVLQTAVGVGTVAGAPLVAALRPDGALVAAGGLAAILALGHLVDARRRVPAGP